MCLIFILFFRDLGALCGVDVHVDVDVDVIYKCLYPVCFLSPCNQGSTLLSMITYVLYPSCFCKIWALFISWMYLNLSYNSCNLSRCLILKRRSSVGQTLIKIKHKVKWMVKVVIPQPPPLCIFFLSATKHLEQIRLNMVFVNILKIGFLNKPKFKVLLKCPIFFYTHYFHKYQNLQSQIWAWCSNNDCKLFLL